jgi:hypothetical protein
VKPVDILGDEISTLYSALCLNGKTGGGRGGGGESEIEGEDLLYVLWLAEDETESRQAGGVDWKGSHRVYRH